ncbi:hypothetical protein [Flavobacterium sp. HJSW_4]|uniref:hypothetical protein n=1 Tax=Flavobacterium sp. HJSW_4 TaxID=3344660 RepID=UPI0035F4157A
MKKTLLLIFSTAVVFTVLTFSTASLQRQVDGSDRYGFPASFYVLYSEMVYPTPVEEMTNFIFLNLVFDIVIAFLITIILFGIYKKTKKLFLKN